FPQRLSIQHPSSRHLRVPRQTLGQKYLNLFHQIRQQIPSIKSLNTETSLPRLTVSTILKIFTDHQGGLSILAYSGLSQHNQLLLMRTKVPTSICLRSITIFKEILDGLIILDMVPKYSVSIVDD